MRDLKKISESTETSIEIIHAIAYKVGNDESAIMREWMMPADRGAIIARARELSDDGELFWGSEGRVL